MKKFYMAALVAAALTFASCGGNKTQETDSLEDSVVAFVQSELKAEMIQELDSLLEEVGKCKAPAFVKTGVPDITLTDQEKKAKPDYLVDPKSTANATVLSEKYRALMVLRIDRNIAKLYDMDVTEYDKAIAKHLTDVNDPAFKASFEETDKAELMGLYAAEKEAGRINFVWQCIAASNVEALYLMSQNVDKFTSTLNDEAAQAVTTRLAHVNVSATALLDFDSDFKPVVESLALLKDLNATTVVELREQLKSKASEIEKSRNLLVKFYAPSVSAH